LIKFQFYHFTIFCHNKSWSGSRSSSDPYHIQQQAGSGSSKIPESEFGFSAYGSETLVRILIRTERRIQTRTAGSEYEAQPEAKKRLQFQIKNECQELRAWSRCCARVSSLSSFSPPPPPWRRQPLAVPPQPSTRTKHNTYPRSCKSYYF
jgi:hypothetical protein